MVKSARPTGIECLGHVAWGAHLCQFYESKQDLADLLVPYFTAGLEGNEYCMWVAAGPPGVSEVQKTARQGIPDFDRYLGKGQMEIVPCSEWYLKDGALDLQGVLSRWIEKLNRALALGYDGIRVAADTDSLHKMYWSDFLAYEGQINAIVGDYRMIALCSYSLDDCDATNALDVMRNHQVAIVRQQGCWELMESPVRRQSERALRESEESFRLSHRPEMAGRIAAQVAHDLGNLLAPLVTIPTLIKTQLPEGHPAVPMCDTMAESARQMADINEDMMVLSRRNRSEYEPLDLNSLVKRTLGRIVSPPPTLVVDLDLASDLLPAKGSPAQLLRVMANLVSNARDAMQDVGLLHIKTENVRVHRAFPHPSRVKVGRYVRLSVTDTGCGIPSEIKDRIFDAFFTTKRSRKKPGLGLGLSIVRMIVEDHRGYVDLESEVGQGTTFNVYLPACRGPA